MEQLNFTPSITLMRGRKLASKAGFFSLCKVGNSNIERRPAFTAPRKWVTPAQVVCSTTVLCGPFFIPLFANVEHTHHAPLPFPISPLRALAPFIHTSISSSPANERG